MSPYQSDWTPSLDWGIPRDHAPLDGPVEDERAAPWVHAPGTSHISRFRLLDASENRFLRKFGRSVDGSSDNRHAAGASQLQVVFKGEGGSGESAQYTYYFSDHGQGRSVADMLTSSPHPYGSVLHPLVIKAGVPYQRDTKA